MAVEDVLTDDFCQLSINALTNAETENCIKLRSLVRNKVMLILVDSGSSHSFISSQFINMTNIPTETIPTKQVKLANGTVLPTTARITNLQWFIQGHTLSSDMLVMDMAPYDAILGYDWLRLHSPMQCDWNNKSFTFNYQGTQITLQGIQPPSLEATPITAQQLYKSAKGNDAWAFTIVESASPSTELEQGPLQQIPQDINSLLQQYTDVFTDPQQLPPQRSYDHAIPLIPGAVPVTTLLCIKQR